MRAGPRGRRLVEWLALAGLTLSLAGCPDRLPIDEHAFACESHADCGSRAFCAEGVCRLFGAPLDVTNDTTSEDATVETTPEPEILGACNTPLVASRYAERATFVVEQDPTSGAKSLRVRLGDLETLVPLSDDVVGLASEEDVPACCEDPCCTLVGPPPTP